MFPAKKLWWRNLTGDGAPVTLDIGGIRSTGHAVARGDECSRVTVEVSIDVA